MFREKILVYQETILGQMGGEIELDESYFGGPRKKKHAQDRLHLKECEFRYNHKDDILKVLTEIMRS